MTGCEEKTPSIPEIVAPVGDDDCFAAALNAHADAVYAGVEGFNMRASANAFDGARFAELVSRAHDAGVRLYAALNVIVFDDELDEVAYALDGLAESGADAVILWDPAVLRLAREREMPVHISTQASVASSAAAAFYESLGARRIVLARELGLDRMKQTIGASRARGSSLTFECFVHGALCIAVSGRCLTSQFLQGRSANRGDCVQPCRRTYRVHDAERDHEMILDGHTVLSARDLCTIDILDRIMATGVSALKIEGRMRDPRYIATTVESYREARDAVMAGVFNGALAERLKKRLEGVFNRGFTRGFYDSDDTVAFAGAEGNAARFVRRYAGRIVNYYRKAGAADVKLEAREIALGDTVLITGPTTGAVEFTVESLRSAENIPLNTASPGTPAGMKTPLPVREGDRVYVLENNYDTQAH